ncbi:hypothetical protein [Chishuiella changwenlii]|uniref:hypothetical protein n=1 Tax=Chishuiella changwenlii TaxID=1434701 RepID=UPI002FD94459
MNQILKRSFVLLIVLLVSTSLKALGQNNEKKDKKVLVVNGYIPHSASLGRLNRTFVEKVIETFEEKGYEVKLSNVTKLTPEEKVE